MKDIQTNSKPLLKPKALSPSLRIVSTNHRAKNLSTRLQDRFWIHAKDEYRLLEIDKITYIKAISNYAQIQCIDGQRELVSKTLSAIAVHLPPDQFIRCHKSYLINIDHVISLSKSSKVILKYGGQHWEIPVSRRKFTSLLNSFTSW